MTNKELLEDLLIEFDELGMEPTTIVQNPSERAIRWKRELMSAIENWGAEVAKEIFEEIDKRFEALLGFYPCNGEFEDAKGFVDFHWKYIKRSIMRDYDPDFEKKYTATTDELPKGE